MSCHCNKNTCPKCNPNSIADIQAKLAELSEAVELQKGLTKFLSCGHPEVIITHADDIACFDITTGIGFDCWLGWGIVNGKSYYSASKKKFIATPNPINRFLVIAGGKYIVGATGGEDSVVLGVNNLPVHNHTISDPGHTHTITDPGHSHGITDPGHNHTQNPHAHDFTRITADGPEAYLSVTPSAYQASNLPHADNTEDTTAVNNANTTGVTVDSNTTGIINLEAQTGIDITNTTGGDVAHENRPPYIGVLLVMYIG